MAAPSPPGPEPGFDLHQLVAHKDRTALRLRQLQREAEIERDALRRRCDELQRQVAVLEARLARRPHRFVDRVLRILRPDTPA